MQCCKHFVEIHYKRLEISDNVNHIAIKAPLTNQSDVFLTTTPEHLSNTMILNPWDFLKISFDHSDNTQLYIKGQPKDYISIIEDSESRI